MVHIPVLQKEVIEYLDPKPNENFIDCTIGSGGHALAILEKIAPRGKLLGIDLDKYQISNIKNQISKSGLVSRTILIQDSYANLKEIVRKEKFKNISGILFDLGFSSQHIDESKRGFTFLKKEPLDMRYDLENPLTAERILNYWSGIEIEKILTEYGEEQFSKIIAKEIIEARRIKSIKNTLQLVEIIKKATPNWYHRQKTHFAAKTFQALRIAVNNELDNLKKVLPQAVDILKPGGRLVIISFHSLEDRIVKNFLKKEIRPSFASTFAKATVDKKATEGKEGLPKILTKKPITPSPEEIRDNPRSRSAKLRVAEK